MRQAKVFVDGQLAGILTEVEGTSRYRFSYMAGYSGSAVSLTMPTIKNKYDYDHFPPFFDNLLPEGMMLEALLRTAKIDRYDYFSQLMTVGRDMVGNVTVEAIE